ncbi:MAG: hypothetical protein WKG01_33995 [Kofleriaceae bacterium]
MTRCTIALALVAAACGKGDKADGGGGKAEPAGKGSPATTVTIDAAAVNALVPEPLKAKLVFEQRDVVLDQGTKHTFAVAAPKGWKQRSTMFGALEPESGGFGTEMKVGNNCDGACEPKDWATVSDKVHFAQLAKATVVKDDKATGKRTMIATQGDETHVIVVWWTEGASEYFSCTAKLGAELKDAAPAFEKACQAVGYTKG